MDGGRNKLRPSRASDDTWLILQAESEGEAGGGRDVGGTAAGRGKARALYGLDGGLFQFRKATGRDYPHAVHHTVRGDVKLEGDVAFLAALARALGVFGLDAAAWRRRLIHSYTRLGWGWYGWNCH